jgi:hypothetical protein
MLNIFLLLIFENKTYSVEIRGPKTNINCPCGTDWKNLEVQRVHDCCIFVVSIPLCYIKFRSYTLSNTTCWMLIHFNTWFIILAICFGYVIAIIRPTQTVELALDDALSGMKHLLFTSIIKIYLKAVIKYWYLINCKTL